MVSFNWYMDFVCFFLEVSKETSKRGAGGIDSGHFLCLAFVCITKWTSWNEDDDG